MAKLSWISNPTRINVRGLLPPAQFLPVVICRRDIQSINSIPSTFFDLPPYIQQGISIERAGLTTTLITPHISILSYGPFSVYCLLLPRLTTKKLLNYRVVGTWGAGGLQILVAIEEKLSPSKEKDTHCYFTRLHLRIMGPFQSF